MRGYVDGLRDTTYQQNPAPDCLITTDNLEKSPLYWKLGAMDPSRSRKAHRIGMPLLPGFNSMAAQAFIDPFRAAN
jgi:hypothetical protein